MPQVGETKTIGGVTGQWDGQTWRKIDAPAQAPNSPGSGPEMYHPGLGDSRSSAMLNELLRTGKEAGIGVLRSPLDLASSIIHPIDTITGMAHSMAHPVETAQHLMDNPRDAGSLLGQMLMAPKLPGAGKAVLEGGLPAVGRGVAKLGRGIESVGASAGLRSAGSLGGLLETVIHHDPWGMLGVAAPPAIEYGGKALQRVGSSMQGMNALDGLKAAAKAVTPGLPDEPIDVGPEMVKEVVNTAQGYKDKGMSSRQAGQRAGWPLGQSQEVPYRAGSGVSIPENPISDTPSDVPDPAYDDYLRSFDQEMAPAEPTTKKLASLKRPKPKGR